MGSDASRHTLDDLLRERAERHPSRVALVDPAGARRAWTFGELDEHVRRCAARLSERGVGCGDRVVVRLAGSPDLFAQVFALVRLGAVPVVVPPGVRESVTRAVRGFTAEGEPSGPDGLALLQLAGDGVGVPRLVPLDHPGLSRSVRDRTAALGADEETVHLVVEPEVTVGARGLLEWLAVLCAGGRLVLRPCSDPDVAFGVVAAERVTHTSLPPELAVRWTQAAAVTAYDLSSLRTLVVGGGVFDERVARRVRPALGCTLTQVFGTVEGLVSWTRPDDGFEARMTTQGRPASADDEVRVVDEEGREVPVGVSGHVLTRGPATVRGYWRSPEHDTCFFTADGFHRTGAYGHVTVTGHVVVERGPHAPARPAGSVRAVRRIPAPRSRPTRPQPSEGHTEMTPPMFPYVMPTPAMLPSDRTGWSLDPARAALLVLNLQNRFVRAVEQQAAPVTELLANARRLVAGARRVGVPVIHSVPAGERRADSGGPMPYARPDGPWAGAEAESFAAQVEPRAGDTVLTARKYSAFARTRLDGRLRELERDQVVILGLYARAGVLMTAGDAWAQDIEAFVVADAVADLSPGGHEFALEWVADTCGSVTATDRVMTAFGADHSTAEAV
ncbi:isochorismatase family protein [Streptomyces sp. NBC_00588]|uniref:isochorismatase family protein n=1 Tax=Streptomyces sp. NBC_00588 TaxID=2975784 RepID=UPI002E819699|nr:isochorismatase family protein [Streptomyces sp. NBC_00588]WUB40290.1 isochorismatase family protein [Streptomyces sp. NBC_00588]